MIRFWHFWRTVMALAAGVEVYFWTDSRHAAVAVLLVLLVLIPYPPYQFPSLPPEWR